MDHNKTKALREGAMMVALTVVLVLISVYVPVFSTLTTIACGIPMAALAVRNGFKVLIPASVAVLLLTVLVTGNIVSAVSLFLMSILPGAAAGFALGKKYSFFSTLFATCLAVCSGWVFELLALELFMGSSFDEVLAEVLTQFKGSMSIMVQAFEQAGALPEGISAEEYITVFLQTVESTLRLYLPALIILSSMVSGYITLRFCGFVIRRTKLASINVTEFSMMKAPRSVTIVAVLCYIVNLFLPQKAFLWPVLANIILILYAIIGVCGLSFVDYYFKKAISSPWARFALYTVAFFMLSVFMPIIYLVLIAIGVFDSGRDYRKIDPDRE